MSHPSIETLSLDAPLETPDSPRLPYEIVQIVLHHADEPSLWRLRKCSKLLRDLADKSLTPYLAEKTLEVKPSFVPGDMFHTVNVISSETDQARRAALQSASDRLTAHFDAYPRSAHLLTRLTVEVGDDEHCDAGWCHIVRFAKTLEHLSIRFVDRSDTPGISHLSSHPISSWTPGPNGDTYSYDNFPSLFRQRRPSLLPRATNVHFYSSARPLENLSFVLRCVPECRELSVSSAYDADEDPRDLYERMESCTSLERASFCGSGVTISELAYCLRGCKALRYLIIHPVAVSYDFMTGRSSILSSLSECFGLHSLCLYGRFVDQILSLAGIMGCDPGCFQNVATLVLEQEGRRKGKDQPHRYPLMDQMGPRAELPALKRLIFIDRTGDTTYPAADNGPSDQLYNDASLLGLFTEYSTLEQVEFIAGSPSYPSDPFADGATSTFAERNVKCCVQRPGRDGLLQVVWPAGQPVREAA